SFIIGSAVNPYVYILLGGNALALQLAFESQKGPGRFPGIAVYTKQYAVRLAANLHINLMGPGRQGNRLHPYPFGSEVAKCFYDEMYVFSRQQTVPHCSASHTLVLYYW